MGFKELAQRTLLHYTEQPMLRWGMEYNMVVQRPEAIVVCAPGDIPRYSTEMQTIADTGWEHNGTPDTAWAMFASNINGHGSIASPTYMELGTDATAFAVGQTALLAAITDSGLDRQAATVGREDSDGGKTLGKCTWTYTWSTITGSKTIGEVGIFNAASDGVMASRKGAYSQAVTTGDSLTMTGKLPLVA